MFLKFAYIKVHSLCFKVLYAFDKCIMSWIQHHSTIQNNFTGIKKKNYLCVLYSTLFLSPEFLGTTDLFTMSVVLSFTKCNTIGIITYSLLRLKKFIFNTLFSIFRNLFWSVLDERKPSPNFCQIYNHVYSVLWWWSFSIYLNLSCDRELTALWNLSLFWSSSLELLLNDVILTLGWLRICLFPFLRNKLSCFEDSFNVLSSANYFLLTFQNPSWLKTSGYMSV